MNDYDFSGLDAVDPAVGAALGVVFFFMMFIYIGIAVVMLWAQGNILQAALGISKWNILWLLVPIANIVFLIKWGIEASRKNKGTVPQASQPPAPPQTPPPPVK